MSAVLDSFCLYHVTAPGQEPDADPLDAEAEYPTLDALSEQVTPFSSTKFVHKASYQVEYVMHHFGLPSCVAVGCGLGANVLVRLARRRPTMVDGLALINCNSQTAGWMEWVYHKVNLKAMKKQLNENKASLPDSTVDYLMW